MHNITQLDEILSELAFILMIFLKLETLLYKQLKNLLLKVGSHIGRADKGVEL